MFLFMPPCLDDCTKVLVAPARPIICEKVVKEDAKPEPEIQVEAYVDDGENKSEVKCIVINDTITCEW